MVGRRSAKRKRKKLDRDPTKFARGVENKATNCELKGNFQKENDFANGEERCKTDSASEISNAP